MKFPAILVLLLLTACMCMQAQKDSRTGVRLGLGISTLTGVRGRTDLPIYSLNLGTPYRFAWDFGVSFQKKIKSSDNFFQLDIVIGELGTNLKNAYDSSVMPDKERAVESISFFEFQFAAYLGKKFRLTENIKGIIGLGPYVETDIYGWDGGEEYYGDEGYDYSDGLKSYLNNIDSEGISISNADGDNYFRNFDAGMMVLAGFEVGRIQIAFNPQFGFTSIAHESPRLTHRAYKISCIYYF